MSGARPGSGRLGTSMNPPGTGMRPGSGRARPPGTSRLRTGQVGQGPGTQAAQGVALQASIKVTDRPMTGQGVMGMKTAGAAGRLVEDTSYYVGLLRKKINDVSRETNRLRVEAEQQSKENSQTTQLEQKYEKLLKQKELLEGQLADYNLAMDKTRTSTDPHDVNALAMHMAEKNRQTGQELDRVFMQRKQRENDTARVEEEIDNIYKSIQARINEMEPDKLRVYNDLHSKQKDMQDRCMQCENKLTEINNRIRHLEADDKSNVARKEYASLERLYQSLVKDANALQEELEIASMDPKDAHSAFVNRVNDFKSKTKALSDKANQQRDENSRSRRELDDMDNNQEDDAGDTAKYELLVQRDKEMTAFMDKFEDTRGNLLSDQHAARQMIVALLEHISRGVEDSAAMPSQEVMDDMENTKNFKEKNLATAQRTMESLQAEKRKREKEVNLLKESEPKLRKELENLREGMTRMQGEMKDFEDVNGMRDMFENTKRHLIDLRLSYQKRRDAMRQQVQAASMEHEAAKRSLSSHDTARELDDTEKRLKHYERSIFEIREFVSSKSRETDYDAVKGKCLKILDSLNDDAIRAAQQNPTSFSAQAKW